MAGSSLPVIDFGEYGLEQDSSLVSDSDLESLAAQLIATLQKDGFVYLRNHGVADELVGILNKHRILVSNMVPLNMHQLHIFLNFEFQSFVTFSAILWLDWLVVTGGENQNTRRNPSHNPKSLVTFSHALRFEPK